MNYLFILNDPPYGSERCYNALRLARSLAKAGGGTIRLFLMGDAALGAMAGQKVPQGYYNVGDMLAMVMRHGGETAVCGTCMTARGLAEENLISGAHKSTMDELTAWTQWADKVLVF